MPSASSYLLHVFCFTENPYQMESKQNKIFGNVIFSPNVIQETWTLLQGTKETVTRVGVPPLGRAPHPRGPLGYRLALIPLPKINIYSKNNLRVFLSCLDSV